jgi:hypothetical protein
MLCRMFYFRFGHGRKHDDLHSAAVSARAHSVFAYLDSRCAEAVQQASFDLGS